jgi:hypothetical protein
MGDLFKALGSGLARFVYAWLMPSIVTSGIFVLLVVPAVRGDAIDASVLGAAGFTLAVLTLSVVFAYASRPIYQFLEGYTMPQWLKQALLRRTHRRFARLQRLELGADPNTRRMASERLKWYPPTSRQLLPTRLGNALSAMEGYGQARYGLDSQTFWYELLAVADDKIRLATEEARAAVDFFMSSMAHLALLLVVCVALVPLAHQPLVLGVVIVAAAGLIRLAYLQAVANVGEWRWSIQALVNTSRAPLAEALALTLPSTYEDEHDMWTSVSGLVHYGPEAEYLRVLNARRAVAAVKTTHGAGAPLPGASVAGADGSGPDDSDS